MPGGTRIKVVWVNGKPPKYLVILNCLTVVLSLVWLLVLMSFGRFGQIVPDALHSSARFYQGKIYYFPSSVLWFHDFGWFAIFALVSIVAVATSFYRKMVPPDS